MNDNASIALEEPDAVAIASQLHSAAIHLLRRVRRHDPASGLTAARLSALSVVVFGESVTMGELARAEQVQLPTTSRLVASLEHDGLVRCEPDPNDRRVVRIYPTDAGRATLEEARIRRVHDLARQVDQLSPEERAILSKAAPILDRLAGDPAPADRQVLAGKGEHGNSR